ncbi:MAG: septum site-determining protein MinC [Parahaliea sp.]
MSNSDFRLKGSTVTVVVLEIHRFCAERFAVQLRERIEQAPGLFQGSPVVISFERAVDEAIYRDLNTLLAQCRDAGLRPIAFKGVSDAGESAAQATGLALLATAGREPRQRSVSCEASEPKTVETTPTGKSSDHGRLTRTITQPVRSGQQIYAEGGDLIVLSQVSEGAEVLADGNIHIYGALRGRALAGVHGDTRARIFCQQLDAELISVAGHFLLSEDLPENLQRQSAIIELDGETLNVVPLLPSK